MARLAILASLFLPAGCLDQFQQRPALNAWIVADTHEVGPTSGPVPQNAIYSAAAKTVSLTAAINETLALQLILNAPQPPLGPYTINISDLSGPAGGIPARDAVSIYRAQYLPIEHYRSWYPQHTGQPTTPRLFADVLVPWNAPRGGGPVTLDTTRNEILWVDLHVPSIAAPGDYTGRLELTQTTADAPAWSAEIRLRVLPVAIPGPRSLPFICRIDPADLFREHLRWQRRDADRVRLLPGEPSHAAAIRLLNNTMRLFQSHRTNPVLFGSFPKFQATDERSVAVDWEPYDALIAPWLDGAAFDDRVGLQRWPMPVAPDHPDAQVQGGFDSPLYARVLAAYLSECRAHFADRNWLDRAFVRIEPPGPLTRESVARVRRLGAILRQSETGLGMVAHLPPRSLRGLGWFNAPEMELTDVGVWSPPAMWFEPEAMRREQSLGRAAWFMPDEPPYSGSLAAEAPSLDAAVLPWQAYRYAAEAAWVERAADFGPSPFEPDRSPAQRHEGLIYPGIRFGLIDTPVPSVRLKRLRRGLLDYELLKLMEKHGRSRLAGEIGRELVRYAFTDAALNHLLDVKDSGWTADPGVLELARTLLVQELANAFDERPAGRSDQLANLSRWASLMNRAVRVQPRVDGVRLAMNDGRLTARAFVSVTNLSDQPLQGRWTSQGGAAQPVGWSQRPSAPIGVPPGQRVLDNVVFDLAAPSFNTDGVFRFQLGFESDRLGAFPVDTRLAVALCPYISEPPVIDGDLSDWVKQTDNTAADFRLVRGRRLAPPGGRENAPAAPTRAYFAHDGQALYIGVICELLPGEAPLWEADNHVPIDGIVPWGQDVVEILLNPDNTLEGASSEIYALQIKPSGYLSATRGCRTDPPVGRVEPWRPEAQLRVRLDHGSSSGANTAAGLPARDDSWARLPAHSDSGAGLSARYASGAGLSARYDSEAAFSGAGLRARYDSEAAFSGAGLSARYDSGAGLRAGHAWTLELRLPLASLGPRAAEGGIWGFNLTRLDARRGEYSSWSATRRHCYSPQSMGNLIVLRP